MSLSVDSTLAAERAARLALRASSTPDLSEVDEPSGVEVLRLVRTARLGDRLASDGRGPVLVLAGGTGTDGEARVRSYRAALLAGLAGFRGTLVSGATTVGIAALAGDLRASAGEAIHAIGYAPTHVPADVELESDPARIDEVRRTPGVGFSVAEPLAYWNDILAAGIAPEGVHVVGIGGGPISSAAAIRALAGDADGFARFVSGATE